LSAELICRKRIQVTGIVQGVGFRPFVYQYANRYKLSGFVYNDGNGVVIEVEGQKSSIEKLYSALHAKKPPLARIDSIEVKEIPLRNSQSFEIIKSQRSDVSTMLSADISMCDECRKEMFDKSNRRYMYPFINCTHCGPRYTIVNALPYDRKNTSMNKFTMCPKCQEEYDDPNNRRYHAQPISCFECGPTLAIENLMQECHVDEEKLLDTIVHCINSGKTVALKGLGGYHLICDATQDEAVLELRRNKHRPKKPFAIMFPDMKFVQRAAVLSPQEERLIESKERPIVVVQKNRRCRVLSKYLAPDIDKLGVFLPYTPLHELLLKKLKKPIVATSANMSDEPIICDQKELFKKMPLVVQISLTHDRAILNACDDSVMLALSKQNIMLRLSRGFAPLSFVSKIKSNKKILAVGANQKNTITLAFNGNMIVSPHIGDLNSIGAMEYFVKTVKTFKKLYSFEPDVIVCDKHPRYETVKWAQKYAKEHKNVAVLQVQHHHAHALASMAEHNLDEEVLAFCFDGTGYGDDGTLWGGEVLLASPSQYKRVAHLKNFMLLGGEKAVKEPRRIALSLLFESCDVKKIIEIGNCVTNSFTKKELETLYLMRKRGINTPKTSSIGRLFDAVYALCGYLEPLAYEGESGMILESLAQANPTDKSYTLPIKRGKIEYEVLMKEIQFEKNKKQIPAKFMNSIVNMIFDITQKYPNKKVVLSGGVFQNSYILKKIVSLFDANGIEYFIQAKTPINDGGISLGQAYCALHKYKDIYGN